jgi:ATP-dependent Clp protease ATP-binding subunit ClpC
MLADSLAIAVACIEHDPPRSMLVVGEPRTGKTSFVQLLAKRISAQGWTVFEADGAAVMAGQIYIGELEKQLRRLITELAVEKKVLWYVPDFARLANSGTHRGQAASILDQILPAVVERRIVLIGETSASQLAELLQARPALRSAAEMIRLPAPSEAQSAQLAGAFTARLETHLGVQLETGTLDTAIHLSRQYLGNSQMPGALIDLLKLACQRVVAGGGSQVRREDLVTTLSQLTGMPSQVLDDRERVDLAALASFFQRRVIGQPEAVSAIVDRIAMHKAGLTDPERPIAVLLFAGPTGTGKTELAKTLAEFLFGTSDRLFRLDMSEYQSEYSVHRILGDADEKAESRALTHRVRRQPFCVVLLDEFEKAHPSVWDLFLQVFDDGRLSDTAGHTVDFRHALIILTSNLGATAHHSSGLGFAATSSEFSREQILREVNKNFRPELVNRLDNVIVFHPLSRELMRGILAKELSRVLQRRGLRHREWAVEWESSTLDFLLDKGFSPTLGARPLKRAIDQYLLAPLAATLVEHRFPEGDQFLFVRSDGHAIQVEFVDPAAPAEVTEEPEAAREQPTALLAATILQARGTAEERAVLEAALQELEEQMNGADWSALEAMLAGQMRRGEFWDRADRHHVLARYALLDRVKAAKQTAYGLQQRLLRSRPSSLDAWRRKSAPYSTAFKMHCRMPPSRWSWPSNPRWMPLRIPLCTSAGVSDCWTCIATGRCSDACKSTLCRGPRSHTTC